MRAHMQMLMVMAGMLGAALALPAAAFGCTGPLPTFEAVVRDARAIALVTLIDAAEPHYLDPSGAETFRVDRVLKGALPAEVTLAPSRSTLCGDRVGADTNEGATLIVAFDVTVGGETIHPAWQEQQCLHIDAGLLQVRVRWVSADLIPDRSPSAPSVRSSSRMRRTRHTFMAEQVLGTVTG